jgi:hypothetical protein
MTIACYKDLLLLQHKLQDVEQDSYVGLLILDNQDPLGYYIRHGNNLLRPGAIAS